MLTAKKIYTQIKRITANIIETKLCDDQNFPSIRKYSEGIEEVSVSTYDNNIFLKSIPYTDMYLELYRNKMFNIKMIDGALIQMQYRFRKDKIESHRLAFSPAPDLEIFQNEPDIYLEDEIYSDILDRRVVSVPLRFDFDDRKDSKGRKTSRPIIHPVSHLTIGQYRNCRIPVSSALTPYQFLKFVIMNFYNTAYTSYSSHFTEHKDCFDTTLYPEETEIVNICTPVYKK
ncbi:DUF2290 domain-containing protein [uncultured Campylobacter sp.]|uniref:DUF2290 domain-containing protein n=1 Tax=uncultured Campylobacter sp. TaxID=218934 RepID=UPI0025D502B1|nr:DUF2290 domain-containing protein [uncultured Campylobacter sp.]